MSSELPPLIHRLCERSAYPHAVTGPQVRETHISWVILTGDYAYKIKKPVQFDFLDFSTLERREFYCREELRLNRRYAPDVYLDVVPITGSTAQPQIAGSGLPIEYAVQMRQFDERELLDHCLREHRLVGSDVDAMADSLAEFHTQAESAPCESRFGRPELILQEARDNLAALLPHLRAHAQVTQLESLSEWTEQAADRLAGHFEERRLSGHVRECHGDLHLGNMFLRDGNVIFFDGIEFSEEFRWIDVMSELAFIVMDFMDRGYRDLGNRLLNAYLERSGDYRGLHLVPFYIVYRALVRAKVDALRLGQAGAGDPEDTKLADELGGYLALANRSMRQDPPQLLITCGVSGSGKTTGSQLLVDHSGLIRIRSDVERKRMSGIGLHESVAQAIGRGAYSETKTRDTYDRLANLARETIQAGYGVVVDATFLRAAERTLFHRLADTLNVPFQIAEFDAEPAELRRRIAERVSRGGDASDAGVAVLEHQLHTREPLTDEERQFVTSPDGLTVGSREVSDAATL